MSSGSQQRANLQKSRRYYDEGCAVSGVWVRLVDRHEGDHLHGLSAATGLGPPKRRKRKHLQAHVVGQNTTLELGFTFLAHHPAHADDLMRQQPHFHTRKKVVFTVGSSQNPP
jgi:hypothetical protein